MEDAGGFPNATPETGKSGSEPRVLVYANAEEMAHAAAERFVQLSREYTTRDGAFRVALSGGKTPQLLYRLLAGDEFRARINWNAVQLFWGDERGVPPAHPESNYGMVQRELLSRVAIPRENVHRMEAERPSLQRAAQVYQEVLQRLLPTNAHGFPRLHLILLGLGTDGHTASLFPSWSGWREAAGWVSAANVESASVRRMTLTLPVLNAAHHVIFLVTGDAKAGILRRVVKDKDESLPAQSVRPTEGELLFMADTAAAAQLNDTRP